MFEMCQKGAAAGPSGMTPDHLKLVLENHRDSDLFHRSGVGEGCCGRLTARQKPNGGIRDIVAGHLGRRLVARMVANSWGLQLSVPLPHSSAR